MFCNPIKSAFSDKNILLENSQEAFIVNTFCFLFEQVKQQQTVLCILQTQELHPSILETFVSFPSCSIRILINII